jgi:carbon-monoxide dehydrogenase medium subunit
MISDYCIPTTVEEALLIKLKCGSSASFIAGGTDLFILLREEKKTCETLIDLNNISDLNFGIEIDRDHIHISACQTVSGLMTSKQVKKYAPVLCEAAQWMAAPNIRNQATLGGNLANASPAADLVPPLIAHDAIAHTIHPEGFRALRVKDFATGVNETVLYPNEILSKISVPKLRSLEGTCFIKLGLREALTISVVNLAIWLKQSDDAKRISQVRIALGSVAPQAIRATEAEDILINKEFNEEVVEKAAKAASQISKPLSDLRASADYRKAMVYELLKIALRRCWKKIEAENTSC